MEKYHVLGHSDLRPPLMAFSQPNTQREIANRKILEDLYLKKQILLKQGVASSLNPPTTPAVASTNSTSPDGHTNAISSMQRAALQQANAQSMGYFISQDSSFGNCVLPVIPRFETK
ncbi:SOSS complex subunit C [Photinus pyralis]|uniref:SOSS complex subunit C n=1 Tax=Photinus pyralis TaxID=7054 RepID=UPI001267372E|nr:SOSS complex subunit C [Photinus pyralis]